MWVVDLIDIIDLILRTWESIDRFYIEPSIAFFLIDGDKPFWGLEQFYSTEMEEWRFEMCEER